MPDTCGTRGPDHIACTLEAGHRGSHLAWSGQLIEWPADAVKKPKWARFTTGTTRCPQDLRCGKCRKTVGGGARCVFDGNGRRFYHLSCRPDLITDPTERSQRLRHQQKIIKRNELNRIKRLKTADRR